MLWGAERALTIRSDGQLENAKEFRSLVVMTRDGAPVRLGDLGRGAWTASRTTRAASWFNGKRAIVLAIQRQPGTNTVAVADAVHALVDAARARSCPARSASRR